MPSERARATGFAAALLAMAIAGCSTAPAPEPGSPRAGGKSAAGASALPARALGAGRWRVDFRLTTSPPKSDARRVFGGAWQETAALAPDGRLDTLTVVPTQAWLSDLPAETPRTEPMEVPAALDVRRADDGRSLALGVRVGNLPAGEAELWRARLTTLLFFEEIAHACLPTADAGAEWMVALDVPDFLARSRFGRWPSPVRIRGKAGRADLTGDALPGRARLVGVLEVGDAAGNTWRMSLDAVFGADILEAATILGAATRLPEPRAAGALTGEFEWRLRRSPAP